LNFQFCVLEFTKSKITKKNSAKQNLWSLYTNYREMDQSFWMSWLMWQNGHMVFSCALVAHRKAWPLVQQTYSYACLCSCDCVDVYTCVTAHVYKTRKMYSTFSLSLQSRIHFFFKVNETSRLGWMLLIDKKGVTSHNSWDFAKGREKRSE
jgi:hypothetical protein